MMKRMHALISGIVQGVGFRYFVLRHAQKLNITGFVRNLPDGRVEVVAEGDEDLLKQFETLLWQGPSFSHVQSVETEWAESKNEFTQFRITY
jgi:acylphosphatase